MKYSLRSLMIVVTLTAVVIGGRIEYLRRWAVFHEWEAVTIRHEVNLKSVDFDFLIWDCQDSRMHEYHERLAEECRAAQWRPWTIVSDQMTDAERESDLERMAKKLVPPNTTSR